MVMFKTRSYMLANALINHPDIRPTLEAGDQYIDSREFLSDSRNLVYAGEEGVVIFTEIEPGLYRAHVGMLKDSRGTAALEACQFCLKDLHRRTGVRMVVGAVPLALRHVRLFCKMLGFKPKTVDDEQEWMVFEGGSLWAA